MARRLTSTARSWYDGLSPASAEIECGGRRHRITWRHGELEVEAHDVLAEHALAALGSDLPPCVEAFDAWCAMRDTEWVHEFLLTGSALSPAELALRKASRDQFVEGAQPSPPGSSTNHARAPWRQQLEREAARRLESESRMWAITLIEALSPAVRRALALSVVVKVEKRSYDDDHRREHAGDVESALTAIAVPLFEQSARRWRRKKRKPDVRFVAETSLVIPGTRPSCAEWAGTDGAYAALSLPLSWFTDVWARGLALVDDCLVLSLPEGPADGHELNVVALRWERGDRRRLNCVEAPARATHGDDGGWRLRWT